ncbi:MAG: hypothetical protein ACI9WU_003212 [Myxococcota bacterium]|jgi:hypothetical protein
MARSRTILPVPLLVSIACILALIAWVGPLLGSAPAPDTEMAETTSLLWRIDTADVRYGAHRCTRWTGTRWDCQLEPWEWVGPYRGKATSPDGVQWKPCIWTHPRSKDGRPQPLTITFDNVPMDAGLSGHLAILDVPQSGDAVEFTVRVDNQQMARLRVSDRKERRWTPWRVSPKPGVKTASVRFELTSKKAAWRHVCFTAFTAGPDQGEEP